MSLRRWQTGVVGVGLLVAAISAAADPPPRPAPPPAATSARPEAATKAPALTLDALKLPAQAVLVVCQEAKDALELIPDKVWLTPARYQELTKEIEDLKGRLARADLKPPSQCVLNGRVEGDQARFQAQFEFHTYAPKASVVLGCQRSLPRFARIDDHLPLLTDSREDGLVVQVDSPGDHKLYLELEVPVAARPGKAGDLALDLGLPCAAITRLQTFTLPGSVPEIRIRTGDADSANPTARARVVDAQHSQFEDVTLGPAERLEISWKGPKPQRPKGPPLLSAQGQIDVQVDPPLVATITGMFTLKALQGETKEWKIQLPPRAELTDDVKVTRGDGKAGEDDRVAQIDLSPPFVTISLKEPTADPLQVVLKLRQAGQGARVPVGPFTVSGARQRGTIVVGAAPDLRLRYHQRGDVRQQEIPAGPRREPARAAFSYWNPPASATPNQPVAPPLELEVEPVKGTVENTVAHELRLTDQGWSVTTAVTVTPNRLAVDQVEISLPPEYQEPASRSEPVSAVTLDPQRHVARLVLSERKTSRFTVRLQALYPVRTDEHRVSLKLPYPEEWAEGQERRGPVTVTLPPGWELFNPESGGPSLWPREREHTWRLEQAPAEVDLAWRPNGPDLPVVGTAQVTLAAGRARVREHLQFRFSRQREAQAPDQVLLRVPPAVAENVRVEGDEGWLREEKSKPATYWVRLNAGPQGAREVTLSFSVPLPGGTKGAEPGGDRLLEVPLVWPVQAPHIRTKVLVWSDPEIQPVLAGAAWEELPAEVVPDRPSLPGLVVSGSGLNLPLSLRLVTPAGVILAPLVADRVLVEAAINQDNYQRFRARFRLTRMNVRHLDVHLPVPPSTATLRAILGGKEMSWNLVSGQTTVARIKVEPELYRLPTTLDLWYEAPPPAGSMKWLSTFHAPVLETGGEVLLGQVRWAVALPPGWVPLYQEGPYASEQRWGWRGGLFAPAPAVRTADLDDWLEAAAPASGPGEAAGKGQMPDPSFVCWRAGLKPLHLVRASEQTWLLACSFVFLLVGLVLSFVAVPRSLFWGTLVVLCVAVALGAVWWPSLLGVVVYGCEPGAVILVLILGFQWMLQQRYRRRVVFLPGFTRVKAGSSLVRNAAHNHRPPIGEPSTVDAPKRAGSGASQLRP